MGSCLVDQIIRLALKLLGECRIHPRLTADAQQFLSCELATVLVGRTKDASRFFRQVGICTQTLHLSSLNQSC